MKKELIEKRRQLLKESNLKEYSEVVKRLIKAEESAIKSVTDVALAHIGLSEEQYMMTQQIIMMNPEYQQVLMQSQQAPEYDSTKDPKITIETAKQIFMEQEELRAGIMKDIMEKAMKNPAFTPEA